PVLAVANVFTLVWYSIVLCDALMLPKEQRLVWPVVSWFGLAGCLALFASLPVWALLTGGGTLAVLTAVRWLLLRYRAGPNLPEKDHTNHETRRHPSRE